MFAVGKKVVSRLSFNRGKVGVLIVRDPLGKLKYDHDSGDYKPHWGIKWCTGGEDQLWESDLKLLTSEEIKEEDFL